MLNFELKDGERFMGHHSDSIEDDKALFGDVIKDRLGYDAYAAYKEVLEDNADHIDALVENELERELDPYHSFFNEVLNRLDEIIQYADTPGTSKKGTLERIRQLRKEVYTSGLF